MNALQTLRETWPIDNFEGTMRLFAVNQTTMAIVKTDNHTPGAPLPPDVKTQYLPRIRCLDCPGKIYTAGPGTTVENFEVHLKNRTHRQAVEKRTGKRSVSS